RGHVVWIRGGEAPGLLRRPRGRRGGEIERRRIGSVERRGGRRRESRVEVEVEEALRAPAAQPFDVALREAGGPRQHRGGRPTAHDREAAGGIAAAPAERLGSREQRPQRLALGN